jgi:hypothetical protein
MRYLVRLVIATGPLWLATIAAAQEPVSELRVTEFRAEPRNPGFGEPFDLYMTLRASREFVVFLPDSAGKADAIEGTGSGAWTEVAGPADSIDIRAVYPMIGYRAGVNELPALEYWVRPAAASAGGGTTELPSVRLASQESSLTEGERRLLRIGGISFIEYAPLNDSTALLIPRPPADVLGGRWSVWLWLAAAVVSAAGVAGTSALAPRVWEATGGAVVARMRRKTPRQEALEELDRVRSLGLHRNGKIDEFYASSTSVLRRYAAQIEPEWNEGLTSSELSARIAGRWSTSRSKALQTSIETAERAKFGAHQPDIDSAERDWTTIRNWIMETPGS